MNIQEYIRVVPDFPKVGINFYDIATLLAVPKAWRYAVEQLAERAAVYKPDLLMGIEARGFLVVSSLAQEMGLPFGMVRKAGKLPGEVLSHAYDLEYGSDTLEVQPDLIADGARVLLVDDLLATGGTLAAAEKLVEKAGAEVVGHLCLIELEGLGGREMLCFPFEALLSCPA